MKNRESEGNLDNRIFVGGLSWDVTERQLEDTFDRYGKISECQIMVGKDTGRPRGFGFITFTDRRGADDAIKQMHGRELGDRVISVTKAEPKAGGDDVDKRGGYSSRGKGGDSEDKCFKCGRPGHWARECPSTGGDQGRFRDPLGHRDRYGDGELDRERYMDGRRRDRYETRDYYQMERYASPRDRLGSERYAMPHHLDNEYGGRERGYDRDRYSRGASDRYGGGAMGPLRDEGRAYRSRSGPYDRPPSRGGGRPSFI
uniref:Glycine-rich RNA-binding protein RZ1B n=1 Tax=Noccaea caerulescens TaxID=107243 RepID=A0A1J3JDC0_NOCCA